MRKTPALNRLRLEYAAKPLLERQLSVDPRDQFLKWFHAAERAKMPELNAMALATIGKGGAPHVRMVLLKEIRKDGLIFFTNTKSQKGRDIATNKEAALLFFWQPLYRQIRIEGRVSPLPRRDVETYFNSRPRGAQISSLISKQSRIITSRAALQHAYKDKERQLQEVAVPLPEEWGGYIVRPTYYEFWQGRKDRLHDRLFYKRSRGGWKIGRLSP